MATWFIGILLVLALLLAARHVWHSLSGGGCSGCPGGCAGCSQGHCACTAPKQPAAGTPDVK